MAVSYRYAISLYNTVHNLNTAETWTPESQNDFSFIK